MQASLPWPRMSASTACTLPACERPFAKAPPLSASGWITWKKNAQLCFSPATGPRLRSVGSEPPMKPATISLISDRP